MALPCRPAPAVLGFLRGGGKGSKGPWDATGDGGAEVWVRTSGGRRAAAGLSESCFVLTTLSRGGAGFRWVSRGSANPPRTRPRRRRLRCGALRQGRVDPRRGFAGDRHPERPVNALDTVLESRTSWEERILISVLHSTKLVSEPT